MTTRAMILLCAILYSGTLAVLPTAANSKDFINIASWGGSLQDEQRDTLFKPFEAEAHVGVRDEEYAGEIGKLQAMISTGSVMLDAVAVDPDIANQGCKAGVFEKLDYTRLQPRTDLMGGASEDCAVMSTIYSTVLAYRKDAFSTRAPGRLSDILDSTFAGRRGLRRSPEGNLELALLVGGVPKDKVYQTLETQGGLSRALSILTKIRDQFGIVWWETEGDPARLLSDVSSGVPMTTAWNFSFDPSYFDPASKIGIVWPGQLQEFDGWAILKGAPHKEQAYAFLRFVTSPSVSVQRAAGSSYGPTNLMALKQLTGDVRNIATAPANSGDTFVIDQTFWTTHHSDIGGRFELWLAGK